MLKRVIATVVAACTSVLLAATPALAGPLPKAITDLAGNPGCC